MTVGRPTKYDQETMPEQARKICVLGAINDDLANFFEVSVSTVNLWKVEHPEFSDAIKRGKQVADSKVARALYERATGYEHPDVHVSNYKGEVTLTPITKRYVPETAAAIFWLKNRDPDRWRDKVQIEAKVGFNVRDLSDAELDRRIDKLEAERRAGKCQRADQNLG